MKSRPVMILLSVFAALMLLAGTCSAGFIAGRLLIPRAVTSTTGAPAITGTTPPAAEQTGTPSALEKLFEPFWQTWKLVHEQYVDQPVDDTALVRGAIRGMLQALGDEHTSYMDPEATRQMNAILQGDEYGGIGAWVDTRGEFLTIISAMPNTPAEKAGLRNGDQVIAVDGQDMTGVDGETVRLKIIGPAGTKLHLTIKRPSQADPIEVDLVRANIKPPSLESRMLDGNVGYVHLYEFGANTSAELRKALQTLISQKPVGIILDLRNNGGGYLQSAVEVSSEFIGEGVILYEQYGDGTRKTYTAQPGGLATDIPLVVLINEGSASASEITAGAIQDLGRGKLVGVTSFGKGSVQVVTDLPDDNGSVRITIARWLTPNGRTIQKIGLTPDVEVKLTQADIDAKTDPQLAKAVELLTQAK
jgi:carboxyl-terminal processing protease